ncbi:MAG: hypothetical protein WCA21_18735 [Terracidiphilus sp.]
MPKITLTIEPYLDYYDELSKVLNNILNMALGGQLQNFGTDIESPALLERAQLTIASFEEASRAIAAVTASLKQNLLSV